MNFFRKIKILNEAFKEQQIIVKNVWNIAENILNDTNNNSFFNVKLLELPNEKLSFGKNLFSSLFISVFHLLGVEQEKRILYGSLNHLFRAWVTSADNLLDNEDKITFDIEMTGDSRVMRQVVVIMLADRIMSQLLDNAVENKVITREDATILQAESLRILLPSAAEEGFEEGGLKEQLSPEFILKEIHPVKTGILFHIPFLAIEIIEKDIDSEKMLLLKDGFMQFGIGCQLLDDIRDITRDYIENRANYFIALLQSENWEQNKKRLDNLCGSRNLDNYIANEFTETYKTVYELALNKLYYGIEIFEKSGFIGMKLFRKQIVGFLIKTLDIKS